MPAPPLPRPAAVVDLLAGERRPMHVNEIATKLGVPDGSYQAFHRLLDNLAYEGAVVAMTGQRFKLSRDRHATRTEFEGTLSCNPRGFGFVAVAGEDSVFVPPESLAGGMHGDVVVVRVMTRSHRGVEGAIVRILRRRSPRIAGTLRRRGKSSWLEPDDARVRGPIVLPRDGAGVDGDAVVVSLTRFPELWDEQPEGKVEATLGASGDPAAEVAKVLVREGIEELHRPEAIAEAEAFGREVSAEALAGRVDLTSIPLPTIDPEDARDHDDAVWAVRHDDGSYKAWVAIADVSHYVRPGTEIDADALARGNSIYLPDRAIPMLPRPLSSNLCSLLPDVVRLCLCVEIDLAPDGEVTKARVVEGFMRSAAKLTYPGVARALGFSSAPEPSPEAEAMRDGLRVLWDLSRILRARRLRRGALDFDLPEAHVVVDEKTGAPLRVEQRKKDPGITKAYELVEDLMLLANETCAKMLVDHDVPGVFRNHPPPDEQKLVRFATLADELGLPFDPDDATDPKKLGAFLKKIAAHPKKHVLNMLLLRAMKQAYYDVQNQGHFGLASKAYLHFTSPIRRYPDLVVHREIRALVRGERIDRSEEAIERLRTAASRASDTERKAMDIEREIVDLHRAILMRDAVGAILEGTVTGFVGSGLFVSIPEPYVDVLVKVEALGPDRYELDDEGLRMIGMRSGERIALGDPMVVKIEDVSIARRQILGSRVAVERDEESGGRVKRARKKTKATKDAPARPEKGRKKLQRKTVKRKR